MAVTEFKTNFGRQIFGVCSSWLRDSQKGEVVPLWLKKGSLKFANDRPLIFVGPGTGVAAFRSAIYSLKHTKQTIVLIFGCRSENDDYYYSSDWAKLKE